MLLEPELAIIIAITCYIHTYIHYTIITCCYTCHTATHAIHIIHAADIHLMEKGEWPLSNPPCFFMTWKGRTEDVIMSERLVVKRAHTSVHHNWIRNTAMLRNLKKLTWNSNAGGRFYPWDETGIIRPGAKKAISLNGGNTNEGERSFWLKNASCTRSLKM